MSLKKPTVSFKNLLLQEPALDPPAAEINLRRSAPAIISMEPHDHGVFVTTKEGRLYIIPWANIRHAELNA